MFAQLRAAVAGGRWRAAARPFTAFSQAAGATREGVQASSRLVWQGARFMGIIWAIDRYCVYLSMTEGPSMMPTLNEMGDIVVVDRLGLSTGLRELQRGDIIVADSPGPGQDYQVCKRIVALEGDLISPHGRDYVLEVPPGHVWVEGDNPHNSVDSRFYGPLPTALVRGRVLAKVWPPQQACWMTPEGEGDKPTANTLMLRKMLDDPFVREHAKRHLTAVRQRQQETALLRERAQAAADAAAALHYEQRHALDGAAEPAAAVTGAAHGDVMPGREAGQIGREAEQTDNSDDTVVMARIQELLAAAAFPEGPASTPLGAALLGVERAVEAALSAATPHHSMESSGATTHGVSHAGDGALELTQTSVTELGMQSAQAARCECNSFHHSRGDSISQHLSAAGTAKAVAASCARCVHRLMGASVGAVTDGIAAASGHPHTIVAAPGHDGDASAMDAPASLFSPANVHVVELSRSPDDSRIAQQLR